MTGSMLYNLCRHPYMIECLLESTGLSHTAQEDTEPRLSNILHYQGSNALHPGRPSAYICTIVWSLEHLIRTVPTFYILS